jgi:hypothetical protein
MQGRPCDGFVAIFTRSIPNPHFGAEVNMLIVFVLPIIINNAWEQVAHCRVHCVMGMHFLQKGYET